MPPLIDRMIRRVTREGHLSGFSDEQVLSVLRDAKASLEPQPATLEIDAPLVIFGDIHGQLRDLLRFLSIIGPPPQHKILFLGDYVDRCKKSFEVIMLLLCYRIKYPQLIHLLRGNHECSKMNRLYGFYEEMKRKRTIYMWKKFQEVFNELPLCAIVSSRLLCMHGGISPEIQNWDSLVTLQKPKSPRACDEGVAVDLMWSDPSSDPCTGFQFNAIRATSYIFGGDTVSNLCELLDISMVVRAHEVVRGGHQFLFDRKLVTVFSAPNYCGTDGNAASIMKVSRRLELSFITLKPRLDTNRLNEEKRQLLEKMMADTSANAKSPDPCARIPKSGKASNNDDWSLIGPQSSTSSDPKGDPQRKSNLLALVDNEDPLMPPPPLPKSTSPTKMPEKPADSKISPPKEVAKKEENANHQSPSTTKSASAPSPHQIQSPSRKRDITPAPPIASRSAQAPPFKTPPKDTDAAKKTVPSPQSSAMSTARPNTPKPIALLPASAKPEVAAQRPSSASAVAKTASIASPQKKTTNGTSTSHSSSLVEKPSQPLVVRSWRQSPVVREAGVRTSDSTSSIKNSESLSGANPKPRSVEEAAKAAIAATTTPTPAPPKSPNEIISATEEALRNSNPAEPKK